MSKFKRKVVITKDLAMKQVEMFLEFYDIDTDFVVDRLKVAIEGNALGMVKAITRGRLSIEEDGEGIKVIQILKNEVAGKSRITYRELDNVAQAASRRGETLTEALFFMLAALGTVPDDVYDEMHPEDRTVAKDVGNLFLTV